VKEGRKHTQHGSRMKAGNSESIDKQERDSAIAVRQTQHKKISRQIPDPNTLFHIVTRVELLWSQRHLRI
jgi:hypothetical protein